MGGVEERVVVMLLGLLVQVLERMRTNVPGEVRGGGKGLWCSLGRAWSKAQTGLRVKAIAFASGWI
jgi:hypothetical protein